MIVILITGIVLAIAIPTWLKARNNAEAKTCQEAQAQLEGAIDRWAFEHNRSTGDPGPAWEDIIGPESMMKKTPKCPAGTALYEMPPVGGDVVCPNVEQYPEHAR